MRYLLWILILGAVLALPAASPPAASAEARLADVDAVCPLFGHRFTGQMPVVPGDEVEFDADLCKRQLGASGYVLAVWACPYCFFSAYQAEFRGSLDPRFRELELATMPLDPERTEQMAIPVGLKYGNADLYYRAAGKGPRFLADLALRAAYAARLTEVTDPLEFLSLRRDELRAVVSEVARPLRVEEAYLLLAERSERQLADTSLAPERQRVLRYLLADAWRNSGEHRRAGPLLAEILAHGQLPESYLAAARQKVQLCEEEARFQAMALDYFRQADAEGQTPPEEAAVVTYLQAEIHRRLGNDEEARKLFDRALTLPGAPPWLEERVRVQQGRLAAGAPATPAATGAP